MKLGDIRGESVVAPDRADQDYVVEGNGDQVAQFTTGGGGDSIHLEPDTSDPGPGNRSNWDVICDLGTAIKQTSVADALTNYRPEGFSEVEIHFATENLDSRLINHDDFLLVNNVGGVPQGPGGTSYLTGYAEAVGLDSSTVDVMNNVISSLQPANEIF